MKKPLFVRTLTKAEQSTLQTGLQSSSAFSVRRCQILLSSAQHKRARQIAAELHCSDQCVREALKAFRREGLTCLQEKSHARHDDQRPFDEAGLVRLQELIRLSPRTFEHDTSVWTLALLAETCQTEGLSRRSVNEDSVRRALKSVGIQWRQAKRWIRSPDPHYDHKKKDATS
jgi:transposase